MLPFQLSASRSLNRRDHFRWTLGWSIKINKLAPGSPILVSFLGFLLAHETAVNGLFVLTIFRFRLPSCVLQFMLRMVRLLSSSQLMPLKTPKHGGLSAGTTSHHGTAWLSTQELVGPCSPASQPHVSARRLDPHHTSQDASFVGTRARRRGRADGKAAASR